MVRINPSAWRGLIENDPSIVQQLLVQPVLLINWKTAPNRQTGITPSLIDHYFINDKVGQKLHFWCREMKFESVVKVRENFLVFNVKTKLGTRQCCSLTLHYFFTLLTSLAKKSSSVEYKRIIFMREGSNFRLLQDDQMTTHTCRESKYKEENYNG